VKKSLEGTVNARLWQEEISKEVMNLCQWGTDRFDEHWSSRKMSIQKAKDDEDDGTATGAKGGN
jgi:hypothetical protein